MRALVAPLAALLGAVLCAAALALAQGQPGKTAAPAGPAAMLPAGAVAMLESDDLGGLLDAWRTSALAARFEKSAAAAELRGGMLYLRLAERLGGLERLAGVSLTAERLRVLLGRRAAIAVYDLGATRFVLVAEVADADLARTPFAEAKKRFPRRQHAGVDYYLDAEQKRDGATLAFALVGTRLVVGNDPERFRDALVLTARAQKLAVDKTAAVPVAMADDADYRRLRAVSPAGAALRVWVRLDGIRDTHHFADFWLWNWAGRDAEAEGPSPALGGIDASLLSLALAPGHLTETRVHLADGALVADLPGPDALDTAACRRLPAALVARTAAPDPTGVAAAVVALLPAGDAADPAADSDATATALAPAAPGRWLELTTLDAAPAGARVPAPRRGGAIAVRLGAPDAFDGPALERALADALRTRTGPLLPLSFQAAPGAGVPARRVTIPLVDPAEWALTVVAPRAGAPWLVIAAEPAAARALADRLAAADGPAPLLATGAPRCHRIDAAGLAAAWRGIGGALAARRGFASEAEARFLTKVIPELLDALALTSVDTIVYRRDDLLIEEAHVRW